jgi:2-C-methyl-D-erythritol 2,4-cyclodiphosphate synthase
VSRSRMRVGLGFDAHAFGGDGALVLGGIEIPGAPGLTGHSDADVVTHAVADALLGAAGLPDLGTLFPASDDSLRGASSIALLGTVMTKVAEAGWQVANVDVVVAAEQPALAAHVSAMAERLGNAVGAPVAIKPKHTEGMGALGRGEGIAAWAVALLVVGDDGQGLD